MESTNPLSACFRYPQRDDLESWRLQGKGSWARRAGNLRSCDPINVCRCIPVMKGTFCEWLIQLRFWVQVCMWTLKWDKYYCYLKKKLKYRKLVLKTWIKPMYHRGRLWEVASTYNCLATYFSSCMVPVVHGDNAVRHTVWFLGCPAQGQEMDSDPDGPLPTQHIPWF